MSDYQLIIRIPIKAIDDPAARVEANSSIKYFSKLQIQADPEVSYKLQRLVDNQAPIGVAL
jgi:hypothetical protein